MRYVNRRASGRTETYYSLGSASVSICVQYAVYICLLFCSFCRPYKDKSFAKKFYVLGLLRFLLFLLSFFVFPQRANAEGSELPVITPRSKIFSPFSFIKLEAMELLSRSSLFRQQSVLKK